jgi:DNA-binding LacI/PurR family transcriptional regulator
VRRRGGDVPRDVSIIGFDDSAFMKHTDPPLSTVRQPIEAMGRAAVERLVSQLEGRRDGPLELLYAPELVVRSTTGRAP